MATINEIMHKCQTCNKDTHTHSPAKYNLSKKHNANLNRIESQNIINENHTRCEMCFISIHKNLLSKHLKSAGNFKKSEQEPEREPQSESQVKRPKF